VEKDIEVVNMIAQNGIKKFHHPKGLRYVDYDAVAKCLSKVAAYIGGGKSVHMPRIGAGLGGGSWEVISGIIKETLCNKGINVFVYDFAK
jgi:O-acetyl-ADP-ribose deacetylase (regulator of RNase III)